MKLIPIFGEKLYAIQYPENEEDILSYLFKIWNDPEYLESFFEQNKKDLTGGYYHGYSVFGAIFKTYELAEDLEKRLMDLAYQERKDGEIGLNALFKPLYNIQSHIHTLNESKAQEYWLRIYALRIESDIYVITGGTIKLTKRMEDRSHTERELHNIGRCKAFLIEQGVVDNEGLIEIIQNR